MEKKAPSKNKPSFESALKELENIARRLEEGPLELEESIVEFEKGIRLAKHCHARLEEAERKIEILQTGEDGKVRKKNIRVKEDTGEIVDDDEVQGSLL